MRRILFLVFLSMFLGLLLWQAITNDSAVTVETTDKQIFINEKRAVSKSSASDDLMPASFQEGADAEFPQTAFITFPNGDLVEISFQLSEWFSVPKPKIANLGLFYGDLLKSVEGGNGTAALAMAGLAEDCRYISRDKATHSDSLSSFRLDGRYPIGNGEYLEVDIGSHQYDMMYKNYKALYELCRNVPLNEHEKSTDWYEKALTLKSPSALKKQASSISSTEPEKAYEIFKELWESGYVDAGGELSYLYSSGLFPNSGGEPDLISAYAYHLATNMVIEANYRVNRPENIDTANRLVDMANSLRLAGENLSPNDQLEAEKKATALLRENPNCCIGQWKILLQ